MTQAINEEVIRARKIAEEYNFRLGSRKLVSVRINAKTTVLLPEGKNTEEYIEHLKTRYGG